MQIVLSKYAGFCEGVERAYRIAQEAASREKTIYILGDLVHNRDVVKHFEKLGAVKIKSFKKLKRGSTLVITAHGSSPEIFESASKLGLHIVDTTCPWVKKAQRIAREFSLEERQVVIVGDPGHPEVVGLRSWAGENSAVVEGPDQIQKLKLGDKVGVLAQTTQSEENFKEVVSALRSKAGDLKIGDTICAATSKRQCSAVDLAHMVDLVLVIGDSKSANTKRLTQLTREEGVRTHQIQNERELESAWLKNVKAVGITAGASTPDWVIKNVVKKIKRYAEKK